MIPYPTQLPVDEIRTVIATIRSGNLSGDIVNFAKAVWEIEGYALAQTVGEMPATFGAMASTGHSSLTNEEAANELERIVQSAEQPEGTMQALNINWKKLASWAVQLLAILLV